ncbi:hypothetical protein NE237_001822 [Protea cynaroides]|uniref:RNase H type-1 domain-containing protein n=1 Tax=Protea cynaroides TaxID=273540 RepID=A0A9Q0KUW6_9MAGN|nr:hypothetical protein NE237_001822 [Protea cynaroides]
MRSLLPYHHPLLTIHGSRYLLFCGSVFGVVRHYLRLNSFYGVVVHKVLPSARILYDATLLWIQFVDDVLPSCSKTMSRNIFSFVAFVCWTLWPARNDLYFQNKLTDPIQVVRCAEKAFNEFKNLSGRQDNGHVDSSLRSGTCTYWHLPPVGYFKVNTDAALCSQTKTSGVGFIIRNFAGKVLLAVSQVIHFLSPKVGEALVIRAAMYEAVSHGFDKLIVESDNLEVLGF